MKNILKQKHSDGGYLWVGIVIAILLLFVGQSVFSQGIGNPKTKLRDLQNAPGENYFPSSDANGKWYPRLFSDMQSAVNLDTINYTPLDSNNIANNNQFVIDPFGDVYFIEALELGGGAVKVSGKDTLLSGDVVLSTSLNISGAVVSDVQTALDSLNSITYIDGIGYDLNKTGGEVRFDYNFEELDSLLGIDRANDRLLLYDRSGNQYGYITLSQIGNKDSLYRDNYVVINNDTVAYNVNHISNDGSVQTLLEIVGKDTVSSYNSLRSIPSFYLSNQVYVNDFTYTFRDSIYETFGGGFTKGSCSENGGTCINGFSRKWDKSNIQPEWWEVGGYSPEIATGNIIQAESDRLNAATIVGGEGVNVVLKSGKTYLQDRSWNLVPRLSCESKATLKRCDAITSTLTADVSSGATSVIVDNASVFRQGHFFTIVDVSAIGGGRNFDENSNSEGSMQIGSIVGDTINIVNSTVARNMNIGDVAVVVFVQVKTSTSEPFYEITLENLNIDGNKSNNEVINDWRHNAGVVLAGLGDADKSRITNCHFYDMSVESFVGSGIIEGCSFEECNGSGIHWQNSAGVIDNPNSLDTFNIHNYVKNCTFKNMMKLGNNITGHSEAIIQTSTGFDNLTVDNCRFYNKEGGKGMAVGDGVGNNWKIINCTFEDVTTLVGSLQTGLGGSLKQGFYFANNLATNCGEIALESVSASTLIRQSNLGNIIKGNIFTNCAGIILQGAISTVISENTFKYNVDYHDGVFFDPLDIDATTSKGSVIYADFVTGLIIQNNQFYADTLIQSDIENAIYVERKSYYDDGSVYGTSTSSFRNYWTQGGSIKSNYIQFFKNGILFGGDNPSATVTKAYSGVAISNNTIVMNKPESGEGIGILAWAGVNVSGNHIFANGSGNSYYPIVVKGMQNLPNVNDSWGAFCLRNVVEGLPTDVHSIYVTGFNNYVAYNTVFRDVTGQGATTLTSDNEVEDNKTLGYGTQTYFGTPVRRTFHRVR